MAHLALTDVAADTMHAFDRFARAAAGLAGARATPLRVWLYDWEVAGGGADGTLRLSAAEGEVVVDLILEHGKRPVLQGEAGLSRKGPEPGNASYYYSLTRMPTRGTIVIGGSTHDVRGTSWMDREWSTSALSPGLAGWDWFALQLDDATELMLYRLRGETGAASPFSAGSFVRPDGTTQPLGADAFTVEVSDWWRSPADGTRYPAAWRITVPALALALEVAPVVANQELNLAVRYWEGAVDASGARAGRPVAGTGYVELTGYAGASARLGGVK
jgi:predicted secreted hydrolase